MSPLQRFQILLEPRQLTALRAIEQRNGAKVSTQIRLAIDAYLDAQRVLTKRELKRLREEVEQ